VRILPIIEGGGEADDRERVDSSCLRLKDESDLVLLAETGLGGARQCIQSGLIRPDCRHGEDIFDVRLLNKI
jgi:hypothetical protein